MIDQRACDGHALLFAAESCAGSVPGVFQANAAQGFGGLALIVMLWKYCASITFSKRREVRHEMKLLEDETDFIGAIPRQIALAELADLHVIHDHAP